MMQQWGISKEYCKYLHVVYPCVMHAYYNQDFDMHTHVTHCYQQIQTRRYKEYVIKVHGTSMRVKIV